LLKQLPANGPKLIPKHDRLSPAAIPERTTLNHASYATIMALRRSRCIYERGRTAPGSIHIPVCGIVIAAAQKPHCENFVVTKYCSELFATKRASRLEKPFPP
jgi:hypothetical protein